MKLRLWVSLMLAASFIVLSASGLLMLFTPYNRALDSIHSVFGLVFILCVVPHLYNNIRSLSGYLKKPAGKQ